MPTYDAPGVYYERVDVSAPAISVIRTDIAGFVGIAERGPVDVPVPVQSWRQFQAHFGEFTGAGFLAYAVRGFFENGGRRCWVVRVASREPRGGAAAASAAFAGLSGSAVWRVAASSQGVWGNDLTLSLKETHRAQTTSIPERDTPNASAVLSTTGFDRGTHVRLSQPGAAPLYRVVAEVDALEGRLLWTSEDPALRLPYHSPVQGLDPGRPILVESIEYTLVVRRLGVPVAVYEGLSLVPEHPRYGPAVLHPLEVPGVGAPLLTRSASAAGARVASQEAAGESAAPLTLPPVPEPVVIEDLRAELLDHVEPLSVDPTASVALEGGADGLRLLTTYDFLGEEVSPLDSDAVKAAKRRGIRALELVNEVSIVAVPDIHIRPVSVPRAAPLPPCIPDPCLPTELPTPAVPKPAAEGELPPVFTDEQVFQVQAALVQHCEDRRDRIAVLDPPFSAAREDALGVGAVRAWRSRFDSKYAALYYPWLRVVDPLRTGAGITRDVPPCGHVAGQYAHADFTVGVHKAPANAPLVWCQDVTVSVNEAVHGLLNPVGINAIRTLSGRGIRIFGARTVSSDPSWRFVNVRRLLMMIEEAIDLALQWAVFEPNDGATRAKVRLALNSFLGALWQRGALAGAAPDEAFRVRCDEENNPPQERENGRLLAEVAVAPAYPLEFVILRVGRTNNEFELAELAPGTGGI